MPTKEGPEITINREVITKEGKKIIEYQMKKLVTKIGTGGHVVLPKDLVGKYVEVYYLEEKKLKQEGKR